MVQADGVEWATERLRGGKVGYAESVGLITIELDERPRLHRNALTPRYYSMDRDVLRSEIVGWGHASRFQYSKGLPF